MSSEIVPRQRYWTGAMNEDYERLPMALTRHKTYDVFCQGCSQKALALLANLLAAAIAARLALAPR